MSEVQDQVSDVTERLQEDPNWSRGIIEARLTIAHLLGGSTGRELERLSGVSRESLIRGGPEKLGYIPQEGQTTHSKLIFCISRGEPSPRISSRAPVRLKYLPSTNHSSISTSVSLSKKSIDYTNTTSTTVISSMSLLDRMKIINGNTTIDSTTNTSTNENNRNSLSTQPKVTGGNLLESELDQLHPGLPFWKKYGGTLWGLALIHGLQFSMTHTQFRNISHFSKNATSHWISRMQQTGLIERQARSITFQLQTPHLS